jgi:RNA polymerase sigma factor (sigma-70 family)
MVFRICLRALRNAHDAEEAFQATFLVLARRASSIRERGSLGDWLYGVARRTALKARTATVRRRTRERGFARELAADPFAEVTMREGQEILDEELSRLPEKYRAPLILCCLQGLTRNEAARQLGCPASTVKNRLEEGRERLRRSLAKRGLTVPAALGTFVLSELPAGAAVPATLLNSTVEAATTIAAGEGVAGTVCASLTALVEGVVKAMFTTKCKVIVTIILLTGALTSGVCALVAGGLAACPEELKRGSKLSSRHAATATAHVPADAPRELPAQKIISVTDERVLSAALPADASFVITVTAAPDAQGVKETRIKKWDAASGVLRSILLEGGNHYYTVALAPSAQQLLVGDASMKDMELYDISDLTNGPRLIRAFANSAKASSLAFASDGKAVLLGSTDGAVHVCSVESGERRWRQQAHEGVVRTVAFSPDGKLVLSAGNDKTVQVRDARDGSLKNTLEGHTDLVTGARFSPDGKLVASGGYDGTVRIWDFGRNKLLHKIDVANTSVRSLAFSPDGKLLAIGGLKNVGKTVLGLWNVHTGKRVQVLSGHEGGAFSAAFSADGTTLMAGGWEGGVGLWHLKPKSGKE